MRSEHDSHIVLATIVPLAACLVFFTVWQSNGGGAISLPLLPIPSFTLPALPTITLPPITVPMPVSMRHLVRTISRNPVTIAAAVLGGTIAGVVAAGTIAEFIRATYRSRLSPIESSPNDAG
ncbi:MAG: hypothetical protein M3Z66_23375 [Chloroflexota bacterium]|nr:hypothetical protein [Chloroflexota bacterium]